MSSEHIDTVQEELSRLRFDVGRIDAALMSAVPAAGADTRGLPQQSSLRAFFERAEGERRPYIVRLEGLVTETFRLSSVRAAILLTLLLDLEDRAASGRGVLDPLRTIAESYRELDESTEAESEKVSNRVRVALYRFTEFLKGSALLGGKKPLLAFDPDANRLRSASPAGKLPTVEVSASDSRISGLVDAILATSPLARVRKYKTVFMPSGQEGYDRLLLELVDHSYPVTLSSMFIRPGLHNYPESILRKIGSSSNRLRRRELLLEGFAAGRCRHTEFLQRSVLWDLIRHISNVGFVSYPTSVVQADVEAHLDFIINSVRSYKNYELVITQAPAPFTLVSFAVHSGVIPEYFTLLYQNYSRDSLYDIGAFAMSDCNVYQAISARVMNWALEDPATIRNRTLVLAELEAIKNHLRTHGPLAETAPIPNTLDLAR